MSIITAPPTVAASPRKWRLTHEEYHRLGAEGFFRGKRVQLIRGEVIEMSPMGGPHAMGTSLTSQILAPLFAPGHYVRVQMPLIFPGSEPEPDVAVIVGGARDYPDNPTTAVLVVEVADSSLDIDLRDKAELYAEAGIPDYWVLDIVARELHVLRDPRPIAAGGHCYYNVTRHSAAETIVPLAAPFAVVKVADLLP